MPHQVGQNAKMSLEDDVGNELAWLIFVQSDLRPKPCSGTAIQKGELRVGTQVDFRGNTSFAWRHWGCLTSQIIANIKKSVESADDVDGFDELKEEDQERIRKAWEEGKVAEEDIPESARKAVGDNEGDEPKKRKRAPPKKKAKKDDDDDEEDDEEKPKKRAPKKAPAKKAPAKKKPTKKKKEESDDSEDFGHEINDVSADEDEEGDDDMETGKKRKRVASKKASGSKKAKPASKAKKSTSEKKKAASGEEMNDDE